MKETIHIYHTNDIHSHFENWTDIKQYLAERREEHEKTGEEMLLFDIGDFCDRWHPLTEASRGKENMALLNDSKYTAATIGNNEGITFAFGDLDSLYNEAHFEVIAANLFYKDGKRPDWALPYKIYKTKGGVKIGVTGATAYYDTFYDLLGWDIKDPLKELERQIERLKKEADVIIVLSHLGIYEDEQLAKMCPEIDLILGGHTHHLLEQGKLVGKTLLGAAGKHGRHAGHIKLEFDTDSRRIITKDAEIESFPPHDVDPYWSKGETMLQKTVVHLNQRIDTDWFTPAELPQMLCDALHEWCKADCTMLNAGLVLEGLGEGNVTEYELLKCLPHPINPCVITVKGAELKEIIKQSCNPDLIQMDVKGLGFRGKKMGMFHYNGIRFDPHFKKIMINGITLDPVQSYRLATTDMFTFGKFFPDIQRAEHKEYFFPEFLRDIMAWKLKKQAD
ncbi:bifunctional metallophosphatase/5'-nucleotidase [Falsibacillus pallidus]|uniref:2',3'-cyclic-nucleotide 2'-phosphodiesterase (5'-nucleotidase family) n=1 Tax=Falsibacillus pallidus TaxID=493781 RepID=A0A370GCM4_9BACI|nr:bifunctional UDP-sugar hydrolase/5'-nucleotidase [Falsibacillus pallidus]RDI41447.1 2',3'-cyclic-nucleotide 2'-phosphodiesterase (5'-nucleotidase family) [Falsibacillus pallidus]